ncbi:hypothetical protein ACIQU6_41625 [Streptomyces sp. NPDC090442]|uniref:hypothetical protein n=1 Tax=Streptomyces sp. NPDC090442 TaxID=3365962 RepID=UPI00380AB6D1
MSLIPRRCEKCGERRRDVARQLDPYTTALEPESDDHDVVQLCEPCAIERFEES